MKPEILDDIETITQFILDNLPASNTEGRAALRIEAWLATYDPNNQ